MLYIFISFCFEHRGLCNLYRGLKNSSKHRLFHSPFDSCNVQDTSHNSIEVLVLIFYILVSKCNALFIAYYLRFERLKNINILCVGLAHAKYIFKCKAERYLTECAPMSPPPRCTCIANAMSCRVTGNREMSGRTRETPDVRSSMSALTPQGVISRTLSELFTHFFHIRLPYVSTQFLSPP